jgi:Kelch motif/RTX calcium-binding nonapeptide repeat (4 copies)
LLWRNLPNLSALVVISAVMAISLLVSPLLTADSQEVWKEVSPSPQVRGEAQGAVVGGKLYVFGGYVDFSPCCPSTTRSDAYDPATNAWTRIADLPEPISHAPVVVDGDTAYLLGGFVGDHPGPSTDHVWKYDTATNTWSEGPPLPERRGAGGGAIVGRTIHYFGGVDRPAGQNVYVDEEEHWALDLDAAEPAWEARAPLPNPRNHLAGAALDGKVYAVGGQHGGDEAGGNQGEVDVYDPATDAWARVADLPTPRGHIGATVLGGRLYAIGGSVNGGTNGLPSAEVTAYDVRADAWAVQTPLPAARKSPVVGTIESREGRLVSSTGNGSGATATTWIGMSIECTLVGTSASETLTGTAGPDAICGRGGNDTIKGLGGDDVLWGEVGADNLQGGTGNDTLHGGLGIDTGSYTASLTAVSASLATKSSTGEGSDTFSGVENLSGSPKADTLIGSAANNKLTGGGGSDTESGGLGDDTVIGSGGADFLYGQGGNDTVNSKDSVNGNDTLRGGAGTDTKITDTQEKSILGFP